MKHLRKFNELFDSEELKNALELDQLQGKLNPEDLVKGGKLMTFSNNPTHEERLNRTFYKLTWKYPLFNICNQKTSDNYAIVSDEFNNDHFIFKNDKNVVVFSIANNEHDTNSYSIIITSEKVDTANPDAREDDYEPYADYEDVSINEVYEIIKKDLIPLLKEGEFYDVLDFHKKQSMTTKFLDN
jgi:hypothetical protein